MTSSTDRREEAEWPLRRAETERRAHHVRSQLHLVCVVVPRRELGDRRFHVDQKHGRRGRGGCAVLSPGASGQTEVGEHGGGLVAGGPNAGAICGVGRTVIVLRKRHSLGYEIKEPNRRFYGAISVRVRGQIVIPAQARRDFGIEVGDKLLVFSDLRYGLAIDEAENIGARDARVKQKLGGSADHD